MANVNYNCVDLDMRHNHQNEMYYEPNIPFYTQMYAPQMQQIERMYFFFIISIKNNRIILISSNQISCVDYCINRSTLFGYPLF